MVNKDENLMSDYYGNVRKTWERWKQAAESVGSVFIPMVTPGFDYTKVNPDAPVLPREDGETLRRHYQLAYTLRNKDISMLLLKSFNDFPEGDSVEPTAQYGTLYIDLLHDLRAGN